MITKHWGVECVSCHKFIWMSSFPVESQEAIGVDVRFSPVEDIRCPACGQICGYRQCDVAISSSPDGAQLQYPYR